MSLGKIQSSMQFIANILNQKKICNNVNPLKNAFTMGGVQNSYSGKLQLQFTPNQVPRNTIPAKVKRIEVILYMNIEEDLTKINNTIKGKYNCSILVKGYDSCGGEYVSSMHLDFDPQSDKCNYIHPHFHLTFGGDKTKDYIKNYSDANIGNMLLLTSPRIAHPPFDIFLAIDFILGNFFDKKTHQEILKDSQYKSAIMNSQERLWKPYMTILAGHWCKFIDCDLKYDKSLAKDYYPHLVV